MKKVLSAVLVGATLLIGSAAPSFAFGRGGGVHGGFHGGFHGGLRRGFHQGFHQGFPHRHVFIHNHVFIGDPFWDPFWWGPPPVYAAPPVVMQPSPPVYIQRPAPGSTDWYYCQNPQGYYPYVKECPGGWLTVVPPSS